MLGLGLVKVVDRAVLTQVPKPIAGISNPEFNLNFLFANDIVVEVFRDQIVTKQSRERD